MYEYFIYKFLISLNSNSTRLTLSRYNERRQNKRLFMSIFGYVTKRLRQLQLQYPFAGYLVIQDDGTLSTEIDKVVLFLAGRLSDS